MKYTSPSVTVVEAAGESRVDQLGCSWMPEDGEDWKSLTLIEGTAVPESLSSVFTYVICDLSLSYRVKFRL